MNIPQDKKQQKRYGLWWKIPLGLVVLILIGLVLVILNIDSIAHTQINKALQRYFAEGGSLGSVDIRFTEGRIGLDGLKINAPKRFGNDPLLVLNRVMVDVDPGSLLDDAIVVEQLVLKDMSLILVRDKNGRLSLQESILSGHPASAPKPTGDHLIAKPASLPALRIHTLRLETIAVRLVDQMRDKPLSVNLQLDGHIDDLFLKDLLDLKIFGGRADITLSGVRLKQLPEQGGGDPWQAGLKRLDIGATGIALEDVAKRKLSLDALTIEVQKVAVDQPAGFGSDKFAGLERLAVATGKLDLASPELVVKEVMIQRPTASIKVRADKATNVRKLRQSLFGVTEEDAVPNKDTAALEARQPTSQKEQPIVRLEQIKIEDGSISLHDETLTGDALVFPLKKIQFEASQVRLFDPETSADPTPVKLSFELEQPGELPTAYFGGVAHMGPLGVGVPLVNSQVRFVGFKLDTLGSMIPATTRATLGATGFDAELALALDTDTIRLEGSAVSDKGVHYDSIHVYGPLEAPNVKMGTILKGVYGRVSDGLINLGWRGMVAGVDLVGGGLNVAKEVGAGAFKMGKNIGESVLAVGTGLATMDTQKLKSGVKGTTVGTARLATGTVKDSASAAGGSLKHSASDLQGRAAVRAWNEGIPERFQTAMQRAADDLSKMPFPPSVD